MQAIIFENYGSPDRMMPREIPIPTPGAEEVLIKIVATGLNAADWRMLRADPFMVRFMTGLIRPKNQILGSDVAGIVAEVGSAVTDFQVGDRVFGEVGRGGFAEYVAAPQARLAHIPDGLDFVTAAALPMAGMTALQGLRDFGKIKAGDAVLINGASGGVGSYAVQIAKAFGATVTAVCSSSKIEIAKSIGADHTIDYTQENFVERDSQYDIIFAANGHQTLAEYERVLTPTGRYVMAGGSKAQMVQAMFFGPLKSRANRKSYQGFTGKPNRADLDKLAQMTLAGEIKPVFDRCYPLADAADAMHYLEAGSAKGKIVIEVDTQQEANHEPR